MGLFKTGLKLSGVAYIVWWFYTLFSTVIPLLNVSIGEINLTLLQIFGLGFFFLGLPIVFYIVVILIADWVFR